MLDAGLARLVDDMLKDRTINYGQHLLGNRFGGRRKRVPRPATGKTALRMRLVIKFPGKILRPSLWLLTVPLCDKEKGTAWRSS